MEFFKTLGDMDQVNGAKVKTLQIISNADEEVLNQIKVKGCMAVNQN